MGLVSRPPLASPCHSFASSLGSTVTGISDLSLLQVVIWGGDLEPETFFLNRKE